MIKSTIEDLLKRGREVTKKYVKVFDSWSLQNQINHIKDEVKEFDFAIMAQTKKKQLEEGCDVIYTVITTFHMLDFSDEEIIGALEKDLAKVEKRCKERCNEKNKV